ncbi:MULTISPECIES: LamG-like jellyroll fold domain-containing protein [unclassified Carboxylicivirga]|uniref:LamG-like jellyroll fold domain-containing protein n=1 Tax=Carboxylicivirga TaxID=1628153 RepID=UPI003D3505B6
MNVITKLLLTAFLLTILAACENKVSVSKPLIAYAFNNSLKNTGMVKTAIYGPQAVAYAHSSKDTCLDLSLTARHRQALSIKLKDNFSLNDYAGYTLAFWVQKHPEDPEAYTILSHTRSDSTGTRGWTIETQSNGAWAWIHSDGDNTWEYKPTAKQRINDEQWHLLALTNDFARRETRLYYDGKNVAIYHLPESALHINTPFIHIGTNGRQRTPKDLFNGRIDELNIWSKVLDENTIRSLYKQRINKPFRHNKIKKELKVMSWNLWEGGTHDGRYVGPQRIITLIKQANPDLIFLQESGSTGVLIADAINYRLYQCSNNLCVLSRFPFGNSHPLFQADKSGCIELLLDADHTLLACPISLSEEPDMSEYIQSGSAHADSIVLKETETRGREAQFILSELKHRIKEANSTPIIMGGNFSSGSHLDWTSANARHNYGLSIAYPVSKMMEEQGFSDAFRLLHPDETTHFGYTHSPRLSTIMKNRTSYIYFKGDKLQAKDAAIIDQHPKGFPSDHAALITTFKWLD